MADKGLTNWNMPYKKDLAMKFKTRAVNYGYKLTETEVAQMKIWTLAKHFFTVPNTVTRFCHKLGYNGFSELKIELKHELENEKTKNKAIETMLQNFDLIDPERQRKVIQLFQKAKGVYFYAQDQTHLIAELGVETFIVANNKFQLLDFEKEVVSHITRDSHDLFFFLSLSGETEVILELARQAKSRGHRVVSLTNLSQNTLTSISDIALHCFTEVTYLNGIEITDKAPMLIILQSLFQLYQEVCKITQENTTLD